MSIASKNNNSEEKPQAKELYSFQKILILLKKPQKRTLYSAILGFRTIIPSNYKTVFCVNNKI